MSAFVSVVVPVRNGAEHLGEQLDALAEQRIDSLSVAGWEVVVADNGSEDGTVGLALSRIPGFPTRLRVVDASARPGAAAARNLGALSALSHREKTVRNTGRDTDVRHVLAFCDADDRVGPDWVSAAASALGGEADSSADAVVGPLRRLETPFDPEASGLGRGALLHADYGVSLLSCNLAILADLFRTVGGFDAGMAGYGGEDTEFSIRLNAEGVRAVEHPDMVLWFRESRSLRTRLSKLWSRDAAHVRIWERHPETYPIQSRVSYVPTELLTLPVALVSAARRGGPGLVLATAVARCAHAGEWVRHRLRGAEATPVLLPDLDSPPEREPQRAP